MAFIRLGSRYINLALVTDVFLQEATSEASPHVDVYLAAPMGERLRSDLPLDVQTRHVHLSGEDAARLLRCLDRRLVEESHG